MYIYIHELTVVNPFDMENFTLHQEIDSKLLHKFDCFVDVSNSLDFDFEVESDCLCEVLLLKRWW